MEPLTRRTFVRTATLAGATWLTPVGHMLARAAEAKPKLNATAKSVIVLWMGGGPSQLETFDPHPGKDIAAGSKAIDTKLKGVQLGEGFGNLAEQMEHISLVRSVMSKEGDHERGTYTVKTGFRPDPTVIHPALGAVLCKHLPNTGVDIPRHVSILPGNWPTRGGYLGDEFNAFRIDDPAGPPADMASAVTAERDLRRLQGLDAIEAEFARGREATTAATRHRAGIDAARRMMTSDQIAAFNVAKESSTLRKSYGETPFGRGCLVARRLIEVGVRCAEVTLDGWDTHANNHAFCASQLAILDPALAALLADLTERKLLRKTIVVVAGEFGRTPQINPAGGRDHWPNGFTIAVAGGPFRGGFVLGETDPEGNRKPTDPVTIGDVHATILHACGIDPAKINATSIGRTVPTAEGKVIRQLLVT